MCILLSYSVAKQIWNWEYLCKMYVDKNGSKVLNAFQIGIFLNKTEKVERRTYICFFFFWQGRVCRG